MGAAREMSRIGAGDECLRRNAAGIYASAAEQLAFDQRDADPAAVSRPASGGPAWPVPMMIASKFFSCANPSMAPR